MLASLDSMLLSRFALLALASMLGIAAVCDWRTHRIPNRVVLVGVLAGLLLNTVLPEGRGFASPLPGAVGLQSALIGAALGLGLLLPLHALGAMGAGDAKLMAAVGAFLGINGVLAALIVSFAVGGLLALFTLLHAKAFKTWLRGLQFALGSRLMKALMPSTVAIPMGRSGARIPFGVAIAIGTLVYVWMASNGELLFLHLLPVS